MKIIKKFTSIRDSRGVITDLLEKEKINAVTLVTFKKGAVRGNHLHKKTTQWNYVISGELKIITQIPGHKPVEFVLRPGELSVIKPNERHAFVGLRDTELMVFTAGPRGGKEYETDTFRLERPLAPGNQRSTGA